MSQRRTREEEVCLDDLNDFGRAMFEEDFGRRGEFMPERTGGAGRIERQGFAAGWIAMSVRHKLWSYFNDEGRARLGGPPAKAPAGRKLPLAASEEK
jgi:hypothetical protein